jgi:hypothetical protein
MDDAAAAATSQQRGGMYTPRVLRSALAKADKSQSDNALRTLREQPVASARTPHEYVASMSRAGQDLGDVVPDSGTAGRALLAGGLLTGGLMNLPATIAAGTGALAKAAPLMAAYTRGGSHLLTQGVLPTTMRRNLERELLARGVPPDTIPMLVQRAGELYGRTAGRPPQRGN